MKSYGKGVLEGLIISYTEVKSRELLRFARIGVVCNNFLPGVDVADNLVHCDNSLIISRILLVDLCKIALRIHLVVTVGADHEDDVDDVDGVYRRKKSDNLCNGVVVEE